MGRTQKKFKINNIDSDIVYAYFLSELKVAILINAMDLCIRFDKNITDEDSYNLKELAKLIEDECNLSIKIEKGKTNTGVKDGGLAMGIAIASLTLAALQTLISVLQYWESKQPQYSLSITLNHRNKTETFLMKNVSASEIQAVISQWQARVEISQSHTESYPEYIEVQISRKR